MRLLKARFLGVESLGYRHGQLYELKVWFDHPKYPVVIRRLDGSGYCPYESVAAFERNWQMYEFSNDRP